MFVSTKRSKRNLRYTYLTIRSCLRVATTERPAITFLERFVSPKGGSAYNFFQMTKEKNIVAHSALCANAIIAPNLEQLTNQLGLINAQNLKIYFKKNKVTASCSIGGFKFGARGLNLQETLFTLLTKINQSPIVNN